MLFHTKPDDGMHPGTAYWKKYLVDRIKKNKNFLGCFIGETGSGKTYSALALMEYILERKIDEKELCMTGLEFVTQLEFITSNPRDKSKITIILWDETGKDLNAKQWQSKMNKTLNIIFQVFRSENIIVFFTVPFLSFIDSDTRKLLHGLFEVESIDFDTKETVVKPFLLQVNQRSGKLYPKFLRVEDYVPIERIRLPLPHPDTKKFYEARKSLFVQDTIKEGISVLQPKVNEPVKSNGLISYDLSSPLTVRQQQVYQLQLKGYSTLQISQLLCLSKQYVFTVLQQISNKMLMGATTPQNAPILPEMATVTI